LAIYHSDANFFVVCRVNQHAFHVWVYPWGYAPHRVPASKPRQQQKGIISMRFQSRTRQAKWALRVILNSVVSDKHGFGVSDSGAYRW
jgi:hypothetical protein